MIDARAIDALLPQTQCGRCGYDGCAPYAQAISDGRAPINRCPPGGATGIARLARLTGLPAQPLDPACGPEMPRRVARIDATLCIGCTKCIQACPVDAIIGANKWLHAVIPALCTGCDLCLAPCPVDCISMVPVAPPAAWSDADAADARRRHDARRARLATLREQREAHLRARSPAQPLPASAPPTDHAPADEMRKRRIVSSAIERARARLAGIPKGDADAPTADPPGRTR